MIVEFRCPEPGVPGTTPDGSGWTNGFTACDPDTESKTDHGYCSLVVGVGILMKRNTGCDTQLALCPDPSPDLPYLESWDSSKSHYGWYLESWPGTTRYPADFHPYPWQ